ncbi:uncharacterized protein LOC143152741 isoform X2 [Ptiloglossa arizonensis]|uniref:uncharacterized protein LOC143152741 isoform X2 n=1 Tax=Ptiloglossa arizonensis TaxID=3350558 RepID=UPI003F9F35FA
MIFVCTIPCFCGLIMKCDNLMAYVNCVGYCIPFVITLMKYIVIYSKRKVLLPVLNMIAEDWAKSKTDVETNVMFRYVSEGTDMFPLPTYYVFDVSQSPYYEIVFVVQVITILMTTCCYLGVDHFFGTLILHICGQLENLQTRLANVKETEKFDSVLVNAVLDHTRLIRYLAEMGKMFI